MIIWGSKGIASTVDTGEFYCPDCKTLKTYRFRKMRKWFTLYFIPIFPFETLGEYIECDECQSTYREDVLNYNPSKEQQKFQTMFFQVVTDIMLMIVLASDKSGKEKMTHAMQLIEHITRQKISSEDAQVAIDKLKQGKPDIKKNISSVVQYLNDTHKELLLRSMITDHHGRKSALI